MGMSGIAVRTTELNDQDREEMVRWREAAADDIHGQTASQLYWILAVSTPSRSVGAAPGPRPITLAEGYE
jgi:hypothetical protein